MNPAKYILFLMLGLAIKISHFISHLQKYETKVFAVCTELPIAGMQGSVRIFFDTTLNYVVVVTVL